MVLTANSSVAWLYANCGNRGLQCKAIWFWCLGGETMKQGLHSCQTHINHFQMQISSSPDWVLHCWFSKSIANPQLYIASIEHMLSCLLLRKYVCFKGLAVFLFVDHLDCCSKEPLNLKGWVAWCSMFWNSSASTHHSIPRIHIRYHHHSVTGLPTTHINHEMSTSHCAKNQPFSCVAPNNNLWNQRYCKTATFHHETSYPPIFTLSEPAESPNVCIYEHICESVCY